MFRPNNAFSANITPPNVNIFVGKPKFVSLGIKNIGKWSLASIFKTPVVMSRSKQEFEFVLVYIVLHLFWKFL